jgi:hypothetical protein
MKTAARSRPRRLAVELSLAQKGVNHLVIATRSDYPRPRACRAWDREFAIADALHCSRIYYANAEVERDVLLAEARGAKIKLLLEGENLLHRDAREGA